MLEHLGAPVLVYSRKLLEVELFDDQDGQPVVAILQQKLNHSLGLELFELLECDRSGEIRRITHLCQDYGVFDQVDILIWIKLRWVTELLGERGCRQKMLQNIDIVMLVLGSLQKSLNPRLQTLVQLSDDLVGARIVVVD